MMLTISVDFAYTDPGHVKIDLHPDAAHRFDEIAASLLGKITAIEARRTPIPFQPEVFVSAVLTSNDIIDVKSQYLRDGTGKEIGRCFSHLGKPVGLVGAAYQEFNGLGEAIQRTASFRRTISLRFIDETLSDWLTANYLKTSTSPFSATLLRSCE